MAQTLIPQATGTSTSDGAGRLDKWYDGSISPANAGNDTYVNDPAAEINLQKDWGAGNTKTVTGFKVYGTSDQGILQAANTDVTVKLQGSSDGSNWTDLYTTTPVADSNSIVISQMTGINTSTAYRYHRLKVSTSPAPANMYILEAEFYEGFPSGLQQAILMA